MWSTIDSPQGARGCRRHAPPPSFHHSWLAGRRSPSGVRSVYIAPMLRGQVTARAKKRSIRPSPSRSRVARPRTSPGSHHGTSSVRSIQRTWSGACGIVPTAVRTVSAASSSNSGTAKSGRPKVVCAWPDPWCEAARNAAPRKIACKRGAARATSSMTPGSHATRRHVSGSGCRFHSWWPWEPAHHAGVTLGPVRVPTGPSGSGRRHTVRDRGRGTSSAVPCAHPTRARPIHRALARDRDRPSARAPPALQHP